MNTQRRGTSSPVGLPGGEPCFRRRRLVGRSVKLALAVAVALVPTLVVSPPAAASPGPLTGVITGPPPIAALPPAGPSQPPASAIASLVTPGAVCGGWQLMNNYAGQAAASTWWQYSCELSECMGICNQDVVYARWIDHYVWDGSQAFFYGQLFLPRIQFSEDSYCTHWWDEPTLAWYALSCVSAPTASFTFSCSELSCSFDGTGSTDSDGTIQDYEWYFGDDTASVSGAIVQHVFTAGRTYTVWLNVYDDGGSTGHASQRVTVSAGAAPTAALTVSCSGLQCSFDGSGSTDADGTIQTYGWSFGDGTGTSGTGSTASHTYGLTGTYPVRLAVTDNSGNIAVSDRDLTVTATVSNAAPTASFAVSCTGLGCTFDAGGSIDPDGAIASYSWSFGDGGISAGPTAQHVYGHPGSFTVTLTVTDNGGAASHATQAVVPVTLTAWAYKTGSVRKVDLTWTGPNGSFDIHRNGIRVATVQATAYTDTVGKRGSYTYTVCAPASAMCSTNVTVNFP
jgi:PKD repeat protein